MTSDQHEGAREFYNREYRETRYGPAVEPEQHRFYPVVTRFIQEYGLSDSTCLEVGSGRGAFQDAVPDYTGVDTAITLHGFLHKSFVPASTTALLIKASIPLREAPFVRRARVLPPRVMRYLFHFETLTAESPGLPSSRGSYAPDPSPSH